MGSKSYSLNSIFKKRIKVKDYFDLSDAAKVEIQFVIKYGLRSERILKVGRRKKRPITSNFFELEWGELLEIQTSVKSGKVRNVLKLVYGIDDKRFYNLELYNCFAAYQFVVSRLQGLARIVRHELASELTPAQKAAGFERLNRFEGYPDLDFLARGDILKYEALLKQPYSIVFRKLVFEKVKNDIERDYLHYVGRKAKRI